MATAVTADYYDVIEKVRPWPPEMKRALVAELVRSLDLIDRPGELRGVAAEKIRGVAAGQGGPPDEETLQRWIEEHRLEKLR